jgi:hypothetical protein
MKRFAQAGDFIKDAQNAEIAPRPARLSGGPTQRRSGWAV